MKVYCLQCRYWKKQTNTCRWKKARFCSPPYDGKDISQFHSIGNQTFKTCNYSPKQRYVPGEFGFCKIGDCVEIMKKIPDKCFDLGFSDPPWGYDYDGKNPKGINQKTFHPERINYYDKFDPDWNLIWFNELRRISKQTVICCGRIHFNWWYRNTEPLGFLTLHFKNGQNSTKISKYAASAYYLCYGDRFKKFKFHRDCYETYIHNGFLRKDEGLLHPSPKDFKTWSKLISELKPKTMIDPFFGSGPIGEVGEFSRIRWFGIEINPNYINDEISRIEKGIKNRPNEILPKYKETKLLQHAIV